MTISLQQVNISTPNDGLGDTLYAAFEKCNDNFTAIEGAVNTSFQLSSDTNPTLGNDMYVAGHAIRSASNGNISIIPDGTGNLILDELSVNGTVITGTNISLTTSGTGVTNINALNATGGTINGVVIGGTNPQQGTFGSLLCNGLTPNTDAAYSAGTALKRWTDVQTLIVSGSKVVLTDPETIAAPANINLNRSYTMISSVDGAFDATLPDGVEGQLLVMTMIVDGGDVRVYVTNKLGFSSHVLFDAVSDSATLIFTGSAWIVTALSGATVV